jgi:hypothetical protein
MDTVSPLFTSVVSIRHSAPEDGPPTVRNKISPLDDGADPDDDIATYPIVPLAVTGTRYLYTGIFLYVLIVAAAAVEGIQPDDPNRVPVGVPVPSVGIPPVYRNTPEEELAGSPLNTARTTRWKSPSPVWSVKYPNILSSW